MIRLRRGLPMLLLLPALLAGGTILYLWTYQPARGAYPIRGIDVSHHQGKIDWHAVAADDVAFAYIKASEGGDYIDPAFADNRRQAQEAGVKTGAYHFFTLCRSGSDQANHFLAVLRGKTTQEAIGDDLPPVVDLEFGGNCAQRPTPTALRAEIDSFIAIVEAAIQRPVVIYATDEFTAAYGAALPDRPRWVRSLFIPPDKDAAASKNGWLFWQYHNAGSVRGILGWHLFGWDIGGWGIGGWKIGGRVDLDVYCGDTATWNAQPGAACR